MTPRIRIVSDREVTKDSHPYCHAKLLLLCTYRFKTVKGRLICADPQSPLAISAMRYMNMEKKTAFLRNPTSTLKTGSTLSATPDWNGEDELRTVL